MRLDLKYQGSVAVERWFGKLTTAGPEKTPIHKSQVPKPPRNAATELYELNRWVVQLDGDHWMYWQENVNGGSR